MRVLLLIVIVAACGARPPASPRGTSQPGPAVTFYRDRAIVRQRVEIEIPDTGIATVRVRVARGVVADDVLVLEREGLQVSSIRAVGEAAPPVEDDAAPDVDDEREIDAELDGELEEESDGESEKAIDAEPPVDEAPPVAPAELDILVTSARTGKAALSIGYTTTDLRWAAAYTLITTPAREQATLRGAIAIRNTTGIAYPNAALRLVDADLGAGARSEKQLAAAMLGPAGKPARELGQLDLVDGELRVPLIDDTRRTLETALVFDPVGTALDRKADAPDRDPSLGARQTSTRVTETYEIRRDARTVGLPGGPARLLERGPTGTLTLVAEARLFDASTRDAAVDTFTVGTAPGVTGRRERREVTIDMKGNVAEDFVITIENTRPRPIDIVLREHLYRGQNWSLAYHSAPATKEGAQQFVMHTRVPARGKTTVLYVVVYTTPLR